MTGHNDNCHENIICVALYDFRHKLLFMNMIQLLRVLIECRLEIERKLVVAFILSI